MKTEEPRKELTVKQMLSKIDNMLLIIASMLAFIIGTIISGWF